MSTITMPFWIFAVSFGVPCFILLCVVGWLLAKLRNPDDTTLANIEMHLEKNRSSAGQQFHSQLLHKQIDTIFSGLNAIIETERLKIRTLLNSNHNMLFEADTPISQACGRVGGQPSSASLHDDEPGTQDKIENESMIREELEQLTGQRELSQSEIELAMRMQARQDHENFSGRKLEAVA